MEVMPSSSSLSSPVTLGRAGPAVHLSSTVELWIGKNDPVLRARAWRASWPLQASAVRWHQEHEFCLLSHPPHLRQLGELALAGFKRANRLPLLLIG